MRSLPAADRILVIRLGAVGDVVRTLPAVSILRSAAPAARITWLVEPAAESAVIGQPWVDDVMVFPRSELYRALVGLRLGRALRIFRDFTERLRAPRYELVLDFHAILKSGFLALLSGASKRVSYASPFAREGADWFATDRARLSRAHTSRFARNEALVRFLSATATPSERPFAVSQAARAWARAALGPSAGPFALVHPGTSAHTPHKRWPLERFASLIERLSLPCLVAFGPDEEERRAARHLVEGSGGRARLAPATTSLAELAALIEASRIFIGADSGPLHVASLVGTPVVQILGPTDPVENAPYPGTPHRSVRVAVACSPCRRGCDAAPCMQRVGAHLVHDAAEALLAETS